MGCSLVQLPATVAPAFSPSDLAGLELWLKADALSLADGAAVSSWTDSSGNARHATQGTSGSQPLYKTNIVNAKPVIRFDGVDDHLVASVPADTSRTLFVVGVADATVAVGARLLALSLRANFQRASGGAWGWGNNQANSAVSIGGSVTTWSLLSVRVNSASSANVHLGTGASVDFDPHDEVTTGTSLTLGSGPSAGDPWKGDIAEVVSYDTALSDANRIQVRDYLLSKYGL